MIREREEDEESGESMEPEQKKARVETYGFVPLEREEEKEEKRVETEEEKKLKAEINQLVCRYPGLIIRTSHKLMERLRELDEVELRNVQMNAMNDVTELRGTPSAETALLITLPVDAKIPGYTEYCQNDTELKRDVETVMIQVFGWFGAAANVIFRLVNNAYKVHRHNNNPHLALKEKKDEEKVAGLYARPIDLEPDQEKEERKDRREGSGNEKDMRRWDTDSPNPDW